MSSLHPQSVNTIRMTTITTGADGKFQVHLFQPFAKIGQHGNIVDNAGSGGIVVGIDAETGILNTDGIDEVNRIYSFHPDTNVRLKGFSLPDWMQAKQMVEEMALSFTDNRYIGFDLAHTENGWVLVEANARGQMIGQQMCDRVGKKDYLEYLLKL